MVPPVITLTRLSGSVFALNSDLIERVDATPDTVITLVDGAKYVVSESLSDVVAAVLAYRSAVIADSANLTGPPLPARPDSAPARRRTLSAVPSVRAERTRRSREA